MVAVDDHAPQPVATDLARTRPRAGVVVPGDELGLGGARGRGLPQRRVEGRGGLGDAGGEHLIPPLAHQLGLLAQGRDAQRAGDPRVRLGEGDRAVAGAVELAVRPARR